MISRTLPVLVGAILAAQAFPQNVVQVQGGGAALVNAVATSPSGTVFVVAPGTYDAPSANDKDVTIVAPQRATLEGPLSVSGLTRVCSLRVKGLDVIGRASGAYPGYDSGVFRLSNGTLVLDDCVCEGIIVSGGAGGRATASIANANATAWGGAAMTLSDVDAAVLDSSFTGAAFSTRYGYSVPAPALDLRNSVVRAERIHVQASTATLGGGDAVSLGGGTATFADSALIPGVPSPYVSHQAYSIWAPGGGSATVWATQLPGGFSGSVTFSPLATAQWTAPGLSVGGTAVARFQYSPATPVAVYLSLDLARFEHPFAAETLFLLATPNYALLASGVSSTGGDFTASLTIPNAPALRYINLWLTGLFAGGLPIHSTAPLGGIVL